MQRLRNGCCGCSLRTTGLTIAMLGIVASTLLLMCMIFALGNMQKFCKQIFYGGTFAKENCEDCQLTSARIRGILMSIGGIFSLGVHTALEVGISKNKPFLVTLYIIVDIASAILLTIIGTIFLAMELLPIGPAVIALITLNIFNFYLVFILYSLKCKIEEGKIDQV